MKRAPYVRAHEILSRKDAATQRRDSLYLLPPGDDVFSGLPTTMITIATFSKVEEAHLLRMRLENAGIPAFIRDENTIQIDWLYSNALGGVRVDVAEEDEDAANAVLNEKNGAGESTPGEDE